MHPLEKFTYCPRCGSSHFEAASEKSNRCDNCGFEYFMNPSSATVALIRNAAGELLVITRRREPAAGTLDLPGGFCDLHETAEQGVAREVMEETGLRVSRATYLFSEPNKYRYSELDIPTLDMFFECEVESLDALKADDDAESCQWIALADIHTELFGLRSVRNGLRRYLDEQL